MSGRPVARIEVASQPNHEILVVPFFSIPLLSMCLSTFSPVLFSSSSPSSRRQHTIPNSLLMSSCLPADDERRRPRPRSPRTTTDDETTDGNGGETCAGGGTPDRLTRPTNHTGEDPEESGGDDPAEERRRGACGVLVGWAPRGVRGRRRADGWTPTTLAAGWSHRPAVGSLAQPCLAARAVGTSATGTGRRPIQGRETGHTHTFMGRRFEKKRPHQLTLQIGSDHPPPPHTCLPTSVFLLLLRSSVKAGLPARTRPIIVRTKKGNK